MLNRTYRWMMVALCLLLVDSSIAQEKAKKKNQGNRATAEEMMKRAHSARAEWHDFSGFKADITVQDGARRIQGSLVVSSEGKLTLQLPDSDVAKWVETDLTSLINHRMPAGEREFDVAFVKGEKANALGRLIAFNDDQRHSVYRVRYNVITEVYREMGPRKLAINVVDVQWNKEKKILPRTYTVSMTDVKTGKVLSTQVVNNRWSRVGKLDLPLRLLKISNTAEGTREVREIRLTNHELLKASE